MSGERGVPLDTAAAGGGEIEDKAHVVGRDCSGVNPCFGL
jgi:hypothetical protein